jgi:hypothetical protein
MHRRQPHSRAHVLQRNTLQLRQPSLSIFDSSTAITYTCWYVFQVSLLLQHTCL